MKKLNADKRAAIIATVLSGCIFSSSSVLAANLMAGVPSDYTDSQLGAITGSRVTTAVDSEPVKGIVTNLNRDPAVFNVMVNGESKLFLRQYTYSTTALKSNILFDSDGDWGTGEQQTGIIEKAPNGHGAAASGDHLYVADYDIGYIGVARITEKGLVEEQDKAIDLKQAVIENCGAEFESEYAWVHGEGIIAKDGYLYVLVNVNPDGGFYTYDDSYLIQYKVSSDGSLVYTSHTRAGKNSDMSRINMYNNMIFTSSIGGQMNYGNVTSDIEGSTVTGEGGTTGNKETCISIGIIEGGKLDINNKVVTVPQRVKERGLDFRDMQILPNGTAYVMTYNLSGSGGGSVMRVYKTTVTNLLSDEPIDWEEVIDKTVSGSESDENGSGWFNKIFAEYYTKRVWAEIGDSLVVYTDGDATPRYTWLTKDFSTNEQLYKWNSLITVSADEVTGEKSLLVTHTSEGLTSSSETIIKIPNENAQYKSGDYYTAITGTVADGNYNDATKDQSIYTFESDKVIDLYALDLGDKKNNILAAVYANNGNDITINSGEKELQLQVENYISTPTGVFAGNGKNVTINAGKLNVLTYGHYAGNSLTNAIWLDPTKEGTGSITLNTDVNIAMTGGYGGNGIAVQKTDRWGEASYSADKEAAIVINGDVSIKGADTETWGINLNPENVFSRFNNAGILTSVEKSSVTVNGNVDFDVYGNGITTNAKDSTVTVNGGGKITVPTGMNYGYYSLASYLGTINMNTGADGKTAGNDAVRLNGDIFALNTGAINLALTTDDSYLNGIVDSGGTVNMWLQNGATWTNEQNNIRYHQDNEDIGNNYVSRITKLTGGDKNKAGVIVQNSTSKDIVIDNYSGNTLVLYGNNSGSILGGNLTITNAATDSVVTLRTDSSGINMSSQETLNKVLDNLAKKLFYTNYSQGNLEGYVQISEGLTSASAAKYFGDVKFSGNLGQGGLDGEVQGYGDFTDNDTDSKEIVVSESLWGGHNNGDNVQVTISENNWTGNNNGQSANITIKTDYEWSGDNLKDASATVSGEGTWSGDNFGEAEVSGITWVGNNSGSVDYNGGTWKGVNSGEATLNADWDGKNTDEGQITIASGKTWRGANTATKGKVSGAGIWNANNQGTVTVEGITWKGDNETGHTATLKSGTWTGNNAGKATYEGGTWTGTNSGEATLKENWNGTNTGGQIILVDGKNWGGNNTGNGGEVSGTGTWSGANQGTITVEGITWTGTNESGHVATLSSGTWKGDNAGTATIAGGEWSGSNTGNATMNGGYWIGNNTGSVTYEGGTWSGTNSGEATLNADWNGTNTGEGQVIIDSGKTWGGANTATNGNVSGTGTWSGANQGTVTVEGITWTGTNESGHVATLNSGTWDGDNAGSATITGGTWSGSNTGNATMSGGNWTGNNAGKVTYEGGTWQGTNSGEAILNADWNGTNTGEGQITIDSEKTWSGVNTATKGVVSGSGTWSANNQGTVTIEGITWTGVNESGHTATLNSGTWDGDNAGSATITGGTWSGSNTGNATMSGGNWTGNNTGSVTYEGGEWSGTNSGEAILNADWNGTNTGEGQITIDSGKTWSGVNTATKGVVSGSGAWSGNNQGTVTIEGITWTGANESGHTATLSSGAWDGDNFGTANVTGGTWTSDNNGTVTVSGGTWSGSNEGTATVEKGEWTGNNSGEVIYEGGNWSGTNSGEATLRDDWNGTNAGGQIILADGKTWSGNNTGSGGEVSGTGIWNGNNQGSISISNISWSGNNVADNGVVTLSDGAEWSGTNTATDFTLKMIGNSVWKVAGTAGDTVNIANFVGSSANTFALRSSNTVKPVFYMDKDSDSVDIANYSGSAEVWYLDYDAENYDVTAVNGGSFTIGNAAEGSQITLVIENRDGKIDTTEDTSINDALNELAKKLYYTAYKNGERYLDGYVKIAESLTAGSVWTELQSGNITFDKTTGQGSFVDDKANPGATYPEAQNRENFTSALTGKAFLDEAQKEYRKHGVIKENASAEYNFTKANTTVTTVDSAIDANKDLTINLNGNALVLKSGDGITTINAANNVTIQSVGTLNANNGISVAKDKKLTVGLADANSKLIADILPGEGTAEITLNSGTWTGANAGNVKASGGTWTGDSSGSSELTDMSWSGANAGTVSVKGDSTWSGDNTGTANIIGGIWNGSNQGTVNVQGGTWIGKNTQIANLTSGNWEGDNESEVTIAGGTWKGNNQGTATVAGGTWTGDNSSEATLDKSGKWEGNNTASGTVKFNGGTWSGSNSGTANVNADGWNGDNIDAGVVEVATGKTWGGNNVATNGTINGNGTWKGVNEGVATVTISAWNGVNSGTVTVKGTTWTEVNSGTATIESGEWTGANIGVAIIEDGTWTGSNSKTATINGGTWSGANNAGAEATLNNGNWDGDNAGTVTIVGGIWTGANSGNVTMTGGTWDKDNSGEVTFEGGTWNGSNSGTAKVNADGWNGNNVGTGTVEVDAGITWGGNNTATKGTIYGSGTWKGYNSGTATVNIGNWSGANSGTVTVNGTNWSGDNTGTVTLTSGTWSGTNNATDKTITLNGGNWSGNNNGDVEVTGTEGTWEGDNLNKVSVKNIAWSGDNLGEATVEGTTWSGNNAKEGTKVTLNKDAVWSGNNTYNNFTLNMNGNSVWKIGTTASKVANFVGTVNGNGTPLIDMTDNSSADITIDNYSGTAEVKYDYKLDNEDTYAYTVYGGNITIGKAAQNSKLTLAIDYSDDIDYTDEDSLYNVLNTLAGKLFYTNHNVDGNLHGYVRINEGLTQGSVVYTAQNAEISYGAINGQGSLNKETLKPGATYPDAQTKAEFTTAITGAVFDSDDQKEYRKSGVIQKDKGSVYNFTLGTTTVSTATGSAIDTQEAVTVNLNGKKLILATSGDPAIKANDDLTINGIGELTAENGFKAVSGKQVTAILSGSSSKLNADVIEGKVNLTLNSGTWSGDNTGEVIATNGNWTGENNGTVTLTNVAWTGDNTGEANVSGGTWNGANTGTATLTDVNWSKDNSGTLTFNGKATWSGNNIGDNSSVTMTKASKWEGSNTGSNATIIMENNTWHGNNNGADTTITLQGAEWQGDNAAQNTTVNLNGSATWKGYNTADGFELNLNNSIWYKTGASTIANLSGVNGIIDMTTGSGDVTVSNYEGNVVVLYGHTITDADSISTGNKAVTVNGGKFTISEAVAGSQIILRTDSSGLNLATDAEYTEKNLVNTTLATLANKLYYTEYSDTVKNLSGKVEIAEGLTSVAKSLRIEDITFDKANNGQGKYEYTKLYPEEQLPGSGNIDGGLGADDESLKDIGVDKGNGNYEFKNETTVTGNIAVDSNAASQDMNITAENALNLQGAQVGVNATNGKDVTVDMPSGSITASDADGVAIKADNANVNVTGEVSIKATTAINAENGATVKVGNGNNKIAVEGNITAGTDSEVMAMFNGQGSEFTGNVSGSGNVAIDLQDNASWQGSNSADASIYVDDSEWKGDNSGEASITLTNGAVWEGKHSGNEALNLVINNGATWKNTNSGETFITTLGNVGAVSTFARTVPAPGVIDMSQSGAVTVGTYSGNFTLLYAHDASTPTDIIGGNFTINNAAKDSVVTLRTDRNGINIHNEEKALAVMDKLANKLFYSGVAGNLTAKVQIAESLTATSAERAYANVFFDSANNQWKINFDDDSTWYVPSSPEIFYGDSETAMMRGAKSAMASTTLMWRSENSDVLQRMGDVRFGGEESGMWAKYYGGESEYDGQKTTYQTSYKAYQLGYDKKLGNDWIVGAAVSYNDAEHSYDRGGRGEGQAVGLSVYGGWHGDKGHYADVMVKGAQLDNEYTVYNDTNHELNGDYSTWGISVSAEYGRRIELKKGAYFDPSVKFTLGRVQGKSYDAASDYLDSEGKYKYLEVEQDAFTTAVGEIGLGLGKVYDQGMVYTKLSIAHEFAGDFTSTFSAKDEPTSGTKVDFGDTWCEWQIGGSMKLNEASYAYATYEKSFGGDTATDWRIDAGLRWTF